MNVKTQSPRDSTSEAPTEKVEVPETAALTMLMHRNVERIANLQKATLDMLSNQTADVTETMRKSLKSLPGSPAAALFDFAENGVEGWISSQKNILDLIVEQSAETAQAAEARSGFGTQSITKLTELVQQTIERTAAAQKTMLDFAAKQNEAVAKAFQQKGPIATPAAMTEAVQSMQRGVATFIDKQKEFVDTATKVAKETVASAKG